MDKTFGASTGTQKSMIEIRLRSDWIKFMNVREFLTWVDDQGMNNDDWDVKTCDDTLDLIISFKSEEDATHFRLKFET